MDKETLISCTIDMLELLISMHDAGSISTSQLDENARTKLCFLKNHIHDVKDEDLRRRGESLIELCLF